MQMHGISYRWKKKQINLKQSKTGQSLSLPLTQDVADAITDYLDSNRPEKASTDILFLTARSPYLPLGESAIMSMFFKRAIAAGYNHSEAHFHGIRRLRGSSLINAGASLPIVMQTLGHDAPKATEKYLSFDAGSMRDCALSLRLTYAYKDNYDNE